jgi:hypothetical protein
VLTASNPFDGPVSRHSLPVKFAPFAAGLVGGQREMRCEVALCPCLRTKAEKSKTEIEISM